MGDPRLPGHDAQGLPAADPRLPAPYQSRQMAVYDPYTQAQPVDDEIDLRQLWRIVSKYRWLIVSVFAACAVTALVASMLARPVYRATALLEVKPSQRLVKFESLAQSDLQDREFLNTQMNILRSESVARAVITGEALAGDPEFSGELRQRGLMAGLGAIRGGLSNAVAAVKAGLVGDDDAAPGAGGEAAIPPEVRAQRALMNRYQGRLTVAEVPNSDLLRVSIDSFSPTKAAALANAHVKAYTQASDQRRFNSTSGAKAFLQKQIEQSQADLETSEKRLTDFARDHNIVDVEDRGNVMETRLEDLNTSLTETREARINAEVAFRQAQAGEFESVPAVLENELIRNLREQYATLRSEYQDMAQTFKDSYPKMRQLKSKLTDIKSTLEEESRNLVAGLENQYRQLDKREQKLEKRVEIQRTKLLNLKDRAISYNILKREWEANKELYAGLLEKQKDVSVAAGMETNNISVVDEAQIPVVKHTPKTTRNVAIAGAFGLMGGIGIAFLLAFLDNTFKTRDDIEAALGLTFLGLVPKSTPTEPDAPLPLLSHFEPTSPMAEAVRSIRTSVLFSRPEHVPRKLLITSTTSGEGKSTIAANLALILAQNGSRVLIMETDLRRPSISRWFKVDASPGLTEYLSEGGGNIVKATPFENVYCVPAGKPHTKPAELLGSPAMDDYLKSMDKHFDFVIIDAPPILGLADSMVLSTRVDGVLLVVKAASTEKDAVQETVKRLRTINAPLVGSILNYVDFSQREYGYYQSYYYGYTDSRRGKNAPEPEQA